jgi:drug/metabolite transporter (DMT)-like permease
LTNQRKSYLNASAAILFWSTVASAFKITLRYIEFTDLLLIASLSSCAILFVILTLQGSVADLFRWSRGEYLRSALLGALNPFLYYFVLFRAYSLLPAQEAQPLNYTWPIVLVLLSALFLKQRPSALVWVALLVSFAGVCIISLRGDFASFRVTNAEGVLLATGSSLIWATYWIANMKGKGDPVGRLFVNTAFGCAYILIFYQFFDHHPIPWQGIAGGVYVGFFEMGITFVLWLRALRLAETTASVGNLVYLSPFQSLLAIHFAVGEEILPSTIIGFVCIVAGILLQQFTQPIIEDSQLSKTF